MSDKEYVEVLQKAFDYKPTTNFILAGPKTLKQLRRQINEAIKRVNNFKAPGVHNQTHEPYIYKYDKIDLETIEKVALETFPKINPYDPYHGLVKIPGLTWIDMAEKECIEDYKQKTIDTILMGNDKKEMKMNRVELEMQRLRERTGDNYILNKMVNTDGVEFFAEYTLYKDYDKYFGLTLSGASINIIDIIEEEFAGLLSSYRISSIQSKNVDSWHITPEENESIKEKLNTAQTDSYTPVYNENDIEDEIKVGSKVVGSDLDIDTSNVFQSMWTETPTNTGEMTENSWTETSTNTGKRCSVPSTFSIDAEQLKGIPMELHLKGARSGYILIKDPTIKNVEERPIKNTENKSRTELVTKIISDVIEELLTEGTCSINITLKQD